MPLVDIEEGFATGFDVTVEQVIGHVSLGRGDKHSYNAAFDIIATHVVEASGYSPRSVGGLYRFPSEMENEVVTVDVSFTKKGDEDGQHTN